MRVCCVCVCDSTIDHLCGTLTKQPKKISLECGETSFAFVIRIDCIPTHPTLAMFCGGFDVCLGCAVAQFLEAAKPTVLGGCKQKKKKGAAGFIQRDFSVPLCPTVSNSFQQLSGLEPLEPLCKSRVRLLLSTVHWWPTVPDTCSGVMSPSSHAMETKNEQSIIEIL